MTIFGEFVLAVREEGSRARRLPSAADDGRCAWEVRSELSRVNLLPFLEDFEIFYGIFLFLAVRE